MKATLIAMSLFVTLIFVLTSPPGQAWANDAKAPTPDAVLKALAEAGQPCAEHAKLKPLVGDWTFTLKMWTDPSQPPAELTGTVKREWIMDQRFVQETVRGEHGGKPFEGLGLVGYDKGQQKFTTVRLCGLCGTIATSQTTCDASGKKFECSKEERCPLTGEMIPGREELIIASPDKIVLNFYKTVDGKETKAMEIVSTRKK